MKIAQNNSKVSSSIHYQIVKNVDFFAGRPGPYFIKVKIIVSLRFKINLIFYLIKEFMKNSCVNFFNEIVNKISI